jgi:hypothetical protein
MIEAATIISAFFLGACVMGALMMMIIVMAARDTE